MYLAADIRKAPTWLSTLLKASGRSQAVMNEQIPPELMPQIARPGGAIGELIFFAHLGQNLLQQEAHVLIAGRVVFKAAGSTPAFRQRFSPGKLRDL